MTCQHERERINEKKKNTRVFIMKSKGERKGEFNQRIKKYKGEERKKEILFSLFSLFQFIFDACIPFRRIHIAYKKAPFVSNQW